MEFNFSVKGDRLRLVKNAGAVSGNANSYVCNFDFSEEYAGLTPFAVFECNGEFYTVEIKENTCLVPYEAVERENVIRVGVFATGEVDEGFKRISTNYVGINVETGAYSVYSMYKAPDVWEEYLSAVRKAQESAEGAAKTAAEAAKTAAADAAKSAAKEAADATTANIDENIESILLSQREDIVADVLAALPDGDEVSY